VAGEVKWAGLSERSQATGRICWAKLLLEWSAAEIGVGRAPALCRKRPLAQLSDELAHQLGNARTPGCGG